MWIQWSKRKRESLFCRGLWFNQHAGKWKTEKCNRPMQYGVSDTVRESAPSALGAVGGSVLVPFAFPERWERSLRHLSFNKIMPEFKSKRWSGDGQSKILLLVRERLGEEFPDMNNLVEGRELAALGWWKWREVLEGKDVRLAVGELPVWAWGERPKGSCHQRPHLWNSSGGCRVVRRRGRDVHHLCSDPSPT